MPLGVRHLNELVIWMPKPQAALSHPAGVTPTRAIYAMRIKVLTLSGVANCLKAVHTTIYRLVHSRSSPAFEISHDGRFDQESIDPWCAARLQADPHAAINSRPMPETQLSDETELLRTKLIEQPSNTHPRKVARTSGRRPVTGSHRRQKAPLPVELFIRL